MIKDEDLDYIKANTPLEQYVEYVNTGIDNNGQWFTRTELKNPVDAFVKMRDEANDYFRRAGLPAPQFGYQPAAPLLKRTPKVCA